MPSADTPAPRATFNSLDYVATILLVLVMVAFFSPFDKPDVTSAAFSPNRVFEAALIIFALAASLAITGLARRSLFFINPPSLLFILFCVIAATSSFFSDRPFYSLQKTAELFAMLFPCSIFVYTVSRHGRQTLVNAIAVALLVTVVYTLVANLALFGSIFHFTHESSVRKVRLMGVFANPTEYSDLICLAIIAVVFSSIRALPKVLLFGGLAFLLYLTDARSAFLAIVVGIFLALFYARRITISRFVFAAVIFVLVIATTILWVGEDSGLGDIESFNGRTFIWQQAFAIISDHPLLGVGFGDSGSHLIAPSLVKAAGSAHNSFLEIAMTTGLTGLLLLLIFLWNAMTRAIFSRNAFAIAVVAYVAFRSLFDQLIFATEVPTVLALLTILPTPASAPLPRARTASALRPPPELAVEPPQSSGTH